MVLHKRLILLLNIILLYLVSFNSILIAQNLEPLKPLLADKPPIIDGIIDDDVWKIAPRISNFKTFIPDFGKDQSEKTIVYMAYDKENLYFAYKCFDSEPDKIRATVTSRDNIKAEDWVCINLDSFNDQQSLYAFYVNPYGIQEDSRFTGNTEDVGVDLIWYSAGKIDSDGYSVEIQIPLKSIRYRETNPVQMSIFFERKISRRSEQASFPPMDPAKGYAFLTQMQPMYYYDVEHYNLFELLPAITYGERFEDEKGNLVSSKVTRDVSLTLKYGITSDLILDATYNPDFSQVEADAGQIDINLRYNLFYPEKRQFFLEGRENFGFAGTSISEVDPVRSVVHTRSILDPIAGIKLAGKIGSNNTVAAIYAIDEATNNIKQNTHFPILRYKGSLSEDSYIGAIAASKENTDTYNRIVGIDGQVRITQASLIEFNGIVSQSKRQNYTEAKFGNSIGIKYFNGTRDLDFDISLKNVSENFLAEMGYITRTGVTTISGLAKPKFYPRSNFFQRIDAEIFSAQTKDNIYNMWETFNHISFASVFLGSLNFKVKYSYSTEIFLGERFKTGGLHAALGGLISNKINFSILARKINAINYSSVPYQGWSNVFSAIAIYQPSEQLTARFDFVFSDFWRESDNTKIFDYSISRLRLTYQFNKYLFFRGIVEYNNFRKQLITDLLASFTYIPGTVLHFGYGSLYEKSEWSNNTYIRTDQFNEMKRSFFFKASYLLRI